MRKLGKGIIQIVHRILNDLWKMKWVIVCIILYWLFARFVLHAFCPMVYFTGLPCPGCGITRASKALLCGHIVKAFKYNPSVFGWWAFGLAFLFYRYVKNREIPHYKFWASLMAILTILIYLYRMVFVFPGSEPMTYQYKNVLSFFFPFYDSLLKNIWKL